MYKKEEEEIFMKFFYSTVYCYSTYIATVENACKTVSATVKRV